MLESIKHLREELEAARVETSGLREALRQQRERAELAERSAELYKRRAAKAEAQIRNVVTLPRRVHA